LKIIYITTNYNVMNSIDKKIALFFVFVLGGYGADAQIKYLQKILDNGKIYKNVSYAPPGNTVRKWNIKKGLCTDADYKKPQRVGILTFYVQDQVDSDVSISGNWKRTSTRKLTGDGVSIVADVMYDNSIDLMKKRFKEYGMELLEPWDYLDTDEKRKAYNEIPFKELKGLRWVRGMTGAGAAGPAGGYRYLPLAHLGASIKAQKLRDSYFNKLGVDALLIVGVDMNAFGNYFNAISAHLLYKSPVDGAEKTPYVQYGDQAVVQLKEANRWAKPKDRKYIGIWNYEDQEYKNKKGKVKTRKAITGFDPNIYLVIEEVSRGAAQLIAQYTEQ